MFEHPSLWNTPVDALRACGGEDPILLFSPEALRASAARFQSGFPGMVTYAVKANETPAVLSNLAAAGLPGYDVASVAEIDRIRALAPYASLHYNNPVRSRAEIIAAVARDVRSFSVDSRSELDKLHALVPAGSEISVRFKLPVAGASYDFGDKFGATEDQAIDLLARTAAGAATPSLTFHPGTQCTDPAAWRSYIDAAARIAQAAGVRIARLNVGGGFPSHRQHAETPALETIFATISDAVRAAFGTAAPALVCEPGRAMVADCMTLATRVRAVRDGGDVFLSDGIYGALAELPILGPTDRITVLTAGGQIRCGAPVSRQVFGPTCDSLDRLPGHPVLPADIDEGDWVLFAGMGAYSSATVTGFNGFGQVRLATVHSLTV